MLPMPLVLAGLTAAIVLNFLPSSPSSLAPAASKSHCPSYPVLPSTKPPRPEWIDIRQVGFAVLRRHHLLLDHVPRRGGFGATTTGGTEVLLGGFFRHFVRMVWGRSSMRLIESVFAANLSWRWI